MASSKRIQVTVSNRAYSALRALSVVSGESMSSIVADHMEAVAPVLERTSQLIAIGKRAQGERVEGVKRIVEHAQAALDPLVAQAVATLETSWDELQAEVAGGTRAVRAKRAGRDPEPARPPPSNHGGQVAPKRLKTKGPRP